MAPSNLPIAIPVRNFPSDSVGLQVFLTATRITGPSTALVTANGSVSCGMYGLIASCAAGSTKAGLEVLAWKSGLVLRMSERASSVCPLTRAKIAVKGPGSCVVPAPET